MSEKKQKSNVFNFSKDFFFSKLNRGVLTLSLILLLAILIYFLRIPAFHVFPERDDMKLTFYTDSVNGGHSKVLNKQTTHAGIVLDFELKEGFVSPYAGFCT